MAVKDKKKAKVAMGSTSATPHITQEKEKEKESSVMADSSGVSCIYSSALSRNFANIQSFCKRFKGTLKKFVHLFSAVSVFGHYTNHTLWHVAIPSAME